MKSTTMAWLTAVVDKCIHLDCLKSHSGLKANIFRSKYVFMDQTRLMHFNCDCLHLKLYCNRSRDLFVCGGRMH